MFSKASFFPPVGLSGFSTKIAFRCKMPSLFWPAWGMLERSGKDIFTFQVCPKNLHNLPVISFFNPSDTRSSSNAWKYLGKMFCRRQPQDSRLWAESCLSSCQVLLMNKRVFLLAMGHVWLIWWSWVPSSLVGKAWNNLNILLHVGIMSVLLYCNVSY